MLDDFDIKYLSILLDYPSPYSEEHLTNCPLSYDSIKNPIPDTVGILLAIHKLETTYNGGHPFPMVLRELLFIGGRSNWVMGGRFPDEHDHVAFLLHEEGLTIERPFFVLEEWESGFHFIYLDEATEDPIVYVSDFETEEDGTLSITALEHTVSGLINRIAIERLQFKKDEEDRLGEASIAE